MASAASKKEKYQTVSFIPSMYERSAAFVRLFFFLGRVSLSLVTVCGVQLTGCG